MAALHSLVSQHKRTRTDDSEPDYVLIEQFDDLTFDNAVICNKHSTAINKLRTQLIQSNEHNIVLTDQLHAMELIGDELQNENTALKQQLYERGTKIDELTNELHTVTESNKSLQNQLHDYHISNRNLVDTAARHTSVVHELQQQLDTTHAESKKQGRDYRRQIRELQDIYDSYAHDDDENW